MIYTVDINRKTRKRNGVETIVDIDKIKWLNEKHVEKRLEEKNFPIIKREYLSRISNQSNNELLKNSSTYICNKIWI